MKILQISTLVPYPPTDGGKLSVFGLIKSLSEKGHEIDLVCYRKHADYDSSFNALKEYCHPHILNVQTDNHIVGAVKNFFSAVPYNASKYYSVLMLNYVTDLVRKKDFDIIQINQLHLGWLADHIKRITNIPLVIRPQNIETMIMKRYSEQAVNPLLKFFSWIQYKKLLKYEPYIDSKFDLCIMISDADCKYLRQKNPNNNVISIPAGVDGNLLTFKKKAIIPHSIAHIGHTDWYPNYDSLNWFISEVFPKILDKYSDATLYVYGGGHTRNFPVPADLKNNINIMGFVDNLWDSLSSIEISVVPLRIGGGIRIKILELLATGNLIVTTSLGKEGIEVSNEEHLLIGNSSDEFASQIIRVFEGYETSQIISKGRNFISKNYVWEVIVEKFEKSYKELILINN